MLNSRVLWVLAQIARREDGELRAARVAAYRQIDPLVRGLVRSKVERSVAAILFETERGEDERHVHRLAFLRRASIRFGHPDEVEAIAERFDKHAPAKAPPRFGVTLCALGTLVVALALALGALYWTGRPPEDLHSSAPENADAWESGGRPPAGDSATRAVFERTLPRWAVALDRLRSEGQGGGASVALDVALERLAADAESVGGPRLRVALEELSGRGRAYVQGGDPFATELSRRAVGGVDRALRDRALGYYVDVELTPDPQGRPRLLLATYTVERVRFYRSGETRVRALRLRRLDHLNYARGLLGYTRPGIEHGLVLVDRVEGHLVRSVLPALGEGAEMPLTDRDSSDEFWATQAQMLAARSARDELRGIVGDEADRLGQLFATRQRVLRSIQERLGSGFRVAEPTTFDFDLEAYAPVEGRVPSDEWRELEHAHRETRDDDVRAAYRRLEEVFLASVERHEVQHRLDYGAGRMESAPEELTRLTGPLLDEEGHKNRLAQHAVAELSAYLSELIRGPEIARTNLALFAAHALNRRRWGTAECYAALVVVEGLAAELELPTGALVDRRRIDRSALAAALVALHARRPAELVDAAARLWARLFGGPLPPLDAE